MKKNLCKKNIHNLKVRNRIRLFKSDVDNFNYGKYDLIISNPPYIKNYIFNYRIYIILKSILIKLKYCFLVIR